jgi:hypothetical protein
VLRVYSALADPERLKEAALSPQGNFGVQRLLEAAAKLRAALHGHGASPALKAPMLALAQFRKDHSGRDPFAALLRAMLPHMLEYCQHDKGVYVVQVRRGGGGHGGRGQREGLSSSARAGAAVEPGSCLAGSPSTSTRRPAAAPRAALPAAVRRPPQRQLGAAGADAVHLPPGGAGACRGAARARSLADTAGPARCTPIHSPATTLTHPRHPAAPPPTHPPIAQISKDPKGIFVLLGLFEIMEQRIWSDPAVCDLLLAETDKLCGLFVSNSRQLLFTAMHGLSGKMLIRAAALALPRWQAVRMTSRVASLAGQMLSTRGDAKGGCQTLQELLLLYGHNEETSLLLRDVCCMVAYHLSGSIARCAGRGRVGWDGVGPGPWAWRVLHGNFFAMLAAHAARLHPRMAVAHLIGPCSSPLSTPLAPPGLRCRTTLSCASWSSC